MPLNPNPILFAPSPTQLLVISPKEFFDVLQPFVNHKNSTGISTYLVSLESIFQYFKGKDDPEKIKRGIAYAYEQKSTKYVMLVGDASRLPVRYRFVGQDLNPSADIDGTYNVSDLYYSNLYHKDSQQFDNWDDNGDGKFNCELWDPEQIKGGAWINNPDKVDGYPYLAIGRLPAHSMQEVETYVEKVIKYESSISATEVTFLADRNLGIWKGHKDPDLATRICEKIQDGSGLGSGAEVVHIGVNYDGSDPIPSSWIRGNNAIITDAIGRSLWMIYIGHGNSNGWATNGFTTPVATLDNQLALPIIFNAACETGKFALNVPKEGRYRGADNNSYDFVYDDKRKIVIENVSKKEFAPPIVTPPPNLYDFPDARDRTIAQSWLCKAEGGAIAFFGETLVCEDDKGADLAISFLKHYTHDDRVLGSIWLKGQQEYWNNNRTNGEVFRAPRIYLGVMTFFGDPSLRLKIKGGNLVYRVTLEQLSDSRLQLWATIDNGRICSCWKNTTESVSDWSNWTIFPMPPASASAYILAVGRPSDGRLQLWTIDDKHQLWSCSKQTTEANSDWTSWTKFQMPPAPTNVFEIAVGQRSDGKLQLWAIDDKYQLWSCWKTTTAPDSIWSSWIKFQMPPAPTNVLKIAVGQLSDGKLQLWAIDDKHQLWSCWKTTTAPDSIWSSWTKFQMPPGSRQIDKIAIGILSDGRLQLWALEMTNTAPEFPVTKLWSCKKETTNPDSNWTPWTEFPIIPAIRDIDVGRLSDGRLQLWAIDWHWKLRSCWQVSAAPDSNWTSWIEFQMPPGY